MRAEIVLEILILVNGARQANLASLTTCIWGGDLLFIEELVHGQTSFHPFTSSVKTWREVAAQFLLAAKCNHVGNCPSEYP